MPETADPIPPAEPHKNPESKLIFKHFLKAFTAEFAQRFSVWTSLAGLLATIGVIFSAYPLFKGLKIEDEAGRQHAVIERMTAQVENAQREAAKMQGIVEALTSEVAAICKKNGPARFAVLSPTDQHALKETRTTVEQLRTRLGSLEAALMTTPEKAIALPMLKQQVDMIQDRTRTDLDSVRGEMGRLFVLVQWCMGILFTIGLAVLGIAINNMRKDKTAVAQKT